MKMRGFYVIATMIFLTYPAVILGIPAYLGYLYLDGLKKPMLYICYLVAATLLLHVYLSVKKKVYEILKYQVKRERLVAFFIVTWIPFFTGGLFYNIIHGEDHSGHSFLFSQDFSLPFIWSLYVVWGITFFMESVIYMLAEKDENKQK